MTQTSNPNHVGFLDGWRGLAIALVLYDHFFPGTRTTDVGRMGVDVFFCLSGLLMSNILYVERVPLRRFYKRRVSRILPVFLLFVVTSFVAHWVLTGEFSKTEFFATATFVRTYFPEQPAIWESSLAIEHLWSLNVEEHCYVLMSVITLLHLPRLREASVLIAASLLSTLIFVAYAKGPEMMPPSGWLGTEVVAVHVLASAGYYLVRHRIAPYVKSWMPIAALAGAAFCYTDWSPWWSNVLLAPYLLAFVINHLEQSPTAVLRVLSVSPLRQLGVWSYSIYIWQQPFYVHRVGWPAGLSLVSALMFGIASFYLFETPLRNWLNENW
jgi:peptidoglycan/LPS O-acetylase OafA/YrhL